MDCGADPCSICLIFLVVADLKSYKLLASIEMIVKSIVWAFS